MLAHRLHRAGAIVDLTDDDEVLSGGQDQLQSGAHERVVVDQQHLYFCHSSSASTTKSPDASGPCTSVPPASATRSCSPSSPAPEPGSAVAAAARRVFRLRTLTCRPSSGPPVTC